MLVIGGSQGALALNTLVPEAVSLLRDTAAVTVRHQAGERTLERALEAYREFGVSADVSAFIDDMAAAYAWADVVVCRSGALTVAELAAAGLGSLLVPFPAAVDDHQTLNARYLTAADAAVLLPQAELTAATLAAELQRCIDDRTLVLERARRARSLALPGATADLADACLALEAAA